MSGASAPAGPGAACARRLPRNVRRNGRRWRGLLARRPRPTPRGLGGDLSARARKRRILLSLNGRGRRRSRRVRILRTGRVAPRLHISPGHVIPAKAGTYPVALSVAPPKYRHSGVGRNPFGAKRPQDGAQRAPSPLIPRPSRHSRESGNLPVALSVAPPKYRHSGVGRNPFGAKHPQDGAQRAPSPLIPRPRVIPAKAGTYPHDRHSRVGGNLAPRCPPPPATLAPCANAPSIPYDGSVARRRRGRKADEAGKGGAPFCAIPAPNSPISAPKQPHRRPKANPALGVNGAK